MSSISEWAHLLMGSVDYALVVGSPGLDESREARALLTALLPSEDVRSDTEEAIVLCNGSNVRFFPLVCYKKVKSHKAVVYPPPT